MSEQQTPPAPDDHPTNGTRALSRRVLLGLGAGAALALATAAQGDAAKPTAKPTATPTPVRVPGYDDPKRWAGRTLHVGAWGGDVQAALRAAVWKPFGAATGCKIAEVTTDYGQLATSVAAKHPYADVLVVDAIWAASTAARGLVQPFDAAVVNPPLVPRLAKSDIALPAYAYAMVGAFRLDAVADRPPRSWAEWWNRRAFPGNRALQRGPINNFEFALLAAGVPPRSLYPLNEAKAMSGMRSISGSVVDRWWDSALEPVRWLASGRADYSSAWHFRVVAGQRQGLPLGFVWNQGLLLTDQWVVPNGASRELAMDFLRYATAAPVQAALARHLPLGPVNPEALPLLDGDLLPDLPTTPGIVGQLVPRDPFWWAANEGDATRMFDSWLLGVPDG